MFQIENTVLWKVRYNNKCSPLFPFMSRLYEMVNVDMFFYLNILGLNTKDLA